MRIDKCAEGQIMLIKWIVLLLLTISGFLFIKYYKKGPWAASIIFSLIIFLLIAFLLQIKISLDYSLSKKPVVNLLIDNSLSLESNLKQIHNIQQLSKIPSVKVFYFADILSENTNELNPEFSSLYDSLNTLRNKVPENESIIVISDFQDNYSISSFKTWQNIYLENH